MVLVTSLVLALPPTFYTRVEEHPGGKLVLQPSLLGSGMCFAWLDRQISTDVIPSEWTSLTPVPFFCGMSGHLGNPAAWHQGSPFLGQCPTGWPTALTQGSEPLFPPMPMVVNHSELFQGLKWSPHACLLCLVLPWIFTFRFSGGFPGYLAAYNVDRCT